MLKSSLVTCALIALTLTPTAAHQPTQAQRDAVRAACRSDFMANCAGVQPGGKEALECLVRSEPKLSPPCRGAVGAIANRRAFRVGGEPLDLFRRYMAVNAREQAYCHFSPSLIANLETYWDAQNRSG